MAVDAANVGGRSGRSLLGRFAVVLLIFVGAAGVFLAVYAAIPVRPPAPSWVSSSGAPVPDDFLYAMFPADNTVPLCDSPDGKPVATLTRAVVNSHAELDAGGWISVNTPHATGWVHLDNLVYTPAQDDGGAAFDAFTSAYRARDPDSNRATSFRLQHNDSGATIATLRLAQDDHWQQYTYEIAAAGVKPLEMTAAFGPGQALGDPSKLLACAGAALAFVIIAGIGLVVTWRGLEKAMKKAIVQRP